MTYANNKDADQPVHLRSLISTFFVRCKDNICIVVISEIQIPKLVSVVEQAGSSPVWSHIPKTVFFHDGAYIIKVHYLTIPMFCLQLWMDMW